MKNLFICSAFLLLLGGNLFADGTLVKNLKDNHALLFTLNGLSELTAGDYAGGIGYQYYFMDKFAARIGFGFNSSNESLADPKHDSASVDKEIGLFTLSVNPGVKYSFTSSSTINGYIGCELLYLLNNETLKHPNFKQSEPETEISTSKFGAGIFLGVEWFAWENVSLGAEYKLMFTSESGTHTVSDNPSESYNLPEKSTFGIGTGQYNFTISFYLN